MPQLLPNASPLPYEMQAPWGHQESTFANNQVYPSYAYPQGYHYDIHYDPFYIPPVPNTRSHQQDQPHFNPQSQDDGGPYYR